MRTDRIQFYNHSYGLQSALDAYNNWSLNKTAIPWDGAPDYFRATIVYANLYSGNEMGLNFTNAWNHYTTSGMTKGYIWPGQFPFSQATALYKLMYNLKIKDVWQHYVNGGRANVWPGQIAFSEASTVYTQRPTWNSFQRYYPDPWCNYLSRLRNKESVIWPGESGTNYDCTETVMTSTSSGGLTLTVKTTSFLSYDMAFF